MSYCKHHPRTKGWYQRPFSNDWAHCDCGEEWEPPILVIGEMLPREGKLRQSITTVAPLFGEPTAELRYKAPPLKPNYSIMTSERR